MSASDSVFSPVVAVLCQCGTLCSAQWWLVVSASDSVSARWWLGGSVSDPVLSPAVALRFRE